MDRNDSVKSGGKGVGEAGGKGVGDAGGKNRTYECRVIRRSKPEDPFGRPFVYDLYVISDDGSSLLEDVSSTEETARKIAAIFTEYEVSALHAQNVFEDLACDPSFLD